MFLTFLFCYMRSFNCCTIINCLINHSSPAFLLQVSWVFPLLCYYEQCSLKHLGPHLPMHTCRGFSRVNPCKLNGWLVGWGKASVGMLYSEASRQAARPRGAEKGEKQMQGLCKCHCFTTGLKETQLVAGQVNPLVTWGGSGWNSPLEEETWKWICWLPLFFPLLWVKFIPKGVSHLALLGDITWLLQQLVLAYEDTSINSEIFWAMISILLLFYPSVLSIWDFFYFI